MNRFNKRFYIGLTALLIIILLPTALADSLNLSGLFDKVQETEEVEPTEEIPIVQETTEPAMIPVLEYHNFGDEEERWTRTYDNFYNDLLWLYNNDYRPVTVDEFISMEFSIEDGKKPVILSFDDASKSQFRFLEDGTIDPNSAVGVLDQFYSDYPDFGSTATFFALPYSFGQEEYIEQKLQYLIETGREIQNHTFGHDDLAEYDAELIQKTLARNEMYMQEILGEDFKTTGLGYPLGHYPDGELLEFVKKGEFEGHEYEIKAAFLVGSEPALMPDNPEFDPYKIPRIQAIDDEWKQWFNREPGEVEKVDENPNFFPFVVGGQSYVVHYPYMDCPEFELERYTFGEVFWKSAEYRKSKVQLNTIPEELKYENGDFYYEIQEENEGIAEQFVAFSEFYREKDLREAILAANPGSEFNIGDRIKIPNIPLVLVKNPVNIKDPRGIYLSGYFAGSDEGKRLLESLVANNGNMVVFDVKEIDGFVFYPSESKIVKETAANTHITLPHIENYIRYWHERGIYLSARIVVFKDIHLSNARPDLAIHNKQGGLWANREGVVWVDPSNRETQDYILTLVEELAEMGIDEVQFDYIRFPTLGDVANTKYNFDEVNMQKYEVIRGFLARVQDRLRPYETKLSIDVYGVVTWNDGYDARSTGQKMECIAPYIDVVYPMTYPSHFGPGFAGYDNPADHPYYFVAESMKLFAEAMQGTNAKIRPWLQAFSWRVNDYGVWYIEEQIRALNDLGINEYTLWNAGNFYDEAWGVF